MLVLDDPKTWPKLIVDQLNARAVKKLLKNNDFFDDVRKEWDIRCIVADVEAAAATMGLGAYHITKEWPGRPFRQNGIRLLDLESHYAEVCQIIRSVKPAVTDSRFKYIKDTLDDWWRSQASLRNGQICFCLTRHLSYSRGALKFPRYFGGEATYLPFLGDETARNKEVLRLLKTIGTPALVEFKISLEKVHLLDRTRLGRALIGHFATSINPEYYDDGLEAQTKFEVDAKDIVAVHPYHEFVAALKAEARA